jgi:hypothetical protein
MRPQGNATFAVRAHGANTFHHLAEDFTFLRFGIGSSP